METTLKLKKARNQVRIKRYIVLTCNSETFLLMLSSPVAPYLKARRSHIALTSHLHNLLHSQCYVIQGSRSLENKIELTS